MTGIRAVLFDVDGTLLDSNDAHAHAWLDALRGHGKDVPYERIRALIGMGSDHLLRELADIDADSPEGRRLVERRSAVFKAHYLPDLGPLPGARMLVDRVRSRGLRCVVVTSSSAAEIADLLRAAAVADLVDVIVSADDADRSKPSPDLVEVALERLGLRPDEAILVGDTPYDVIAAKEAGVACIALRSGGYRDRELASAIAIYGGPAELASRLDDSPIIRGVEEGRMLRTTRAGRAAARG